MGKELKKAIEEDVFRYFGKRKLSFKDKIFLAEELKYIMLFRKIQYASNVFVLKWNKLKLYRMSQKTMIQIPPDVKIGRGLYIGHCGRIIINKEVTMGNNINLGTGVVIGQQNRGALKGVPTIGNQVWIGSNAVIVGHINIGDDVLIAPGAYVNMSVPAHSIVVGNPGVIHAKENACEEYINRTI